MLRKIDRSVWAQGQSDTKNLYGSVAYWYQSETYERGLKLLRKGDLKASNNNNNDNDNSYMKVGLHRWIKIINFWNIFVFSWKNCVVSKNFQSQVRSWFLIIYEKILIKKKRIIWMLKDSSTSIAEKESTWYLLLIRTTYRFF